MPHLFALLFLLAATPFWEAKPCADWSEEELLEFMGNSPWAQPAESVGSRRSGAIQAFLATAKPMQAAELEYRRRRLPKDTPADPSWDEFQEFLARDATKYLVLAVSIPIAASQDAREMATMENDSFLRLGKQKIKMSGYFPPSPTDPWTRLIFPRKDFKGVKEFDFEIYVPGTGTSYRQVFFRLKEMTYRGQLEM